MTVHVRRERATLFIQIDRPDRRNAIDRTTADALSAAFDRFEADADACVAVLSGAGGTFCAGADLHAFAAGDGNRLAPDGDAPLGPSRRRPSKPVIAAIEGHAVAGGLELALLADLRVMAADATLGVFCRRVGVPLIDGGTVRLPRLIGEGRALDLILTGRPVGADEALAIGLVSRVVPPGEALATAAALADQLARFPQAALRSDRASVYAQAGRPLDAALAEEFRLGMQAVASGEALTGASRFRGGAGRGGAAID